MKVEEKERRGGHRLGVVYRKAPGVWYLWHEGRRREVSIGYLVGDFAPADIQDDPAGIIERALILAMPPHSPQHSQPSRTNPKYSPGKEWIKFTPLSDAGAFYWHWSQQRDEAEWLHGWAKKSARQRKRGKISQFSVIGLSPEYANWKAPEENCIINVEPVKKEDKEIRPLYLYFIRSGGGPVKIGISENVQTRLYTLQNAHHERLILLKSVAIASPAVERQLHHRFDSSRLRGEWFAWTPELESFIESCTPESLESLLEAPCSSTPKAARS